jgi:hypothetical protein
VQVSIRTDREHSRAFGLVHPVKLTVEKSSSGDLQLEIPRLEEDEVVVIE